MTVRPDCLAIELGSDYIRWGAEFADRVLIRTVPVSDGELAGISADQRTGALTRKILRISGSGKESPCRMRL